MNVYPTKTSLSSRSRMKLFGVSRRIKSVYCINRCDSQRHMTVEMAQMTHSNMTLVLKKATPGHGSLG
jgi:hypothetical protein